MRLASCVLSLGLAAASAQAETITLGFGDFFDPVPGTSGLSGEWGLWGYRADATTDEYIPEGGAADLGRISTNQTGYDVSVQSLTISRGDGQAFSLDSISLPDFYTGLIGEYEGYSVLPGGGTSYDGPYETIQLLWDMVRITGQTAGGAEVVHTLDPMQPAELAGLTGSSNFVSNGDPVISLAGAGLIDLVSVTFSAVLPATGGTSLLCDTVNLSRVDPVFAASGFCSGTVDPASGIDGVMAYADYWGPRNDVGYYTLGGLTVTRETAAQAPAPVPEPVPAPAPEPVPAPAPVPLPAAGWLLLAGLGALRLMRRG